MSVDPSVVINTGVPALDGDLVQTLEGLDLPTFGHLFDQGFAQGLRCVTGPTKLVVGRALTVRVPGTDSRILHYAIHLAQPGDFIVVDTGLNTTYSAVGGGVVGALAAKGVAGIATSGVATDIVELREAGIPVFATGLAPVTTRVSANPIRGEINVPATVGGVAVTPGLVVMADENGLLFKPAAELAERIPRVQELLEWEVGAMARVRDGASLASEILANEDIEALAAATKEM